VRGVGFADLLQRQHVRQGVHPRAAVGFRDFDPHEPHFAHFFDCRVGKLAGFVEFGGDRGDFLLGEIARRLTDHKMLFGQ